MNLSVIIPCHNAAHTLGDQLDALARQDFAQPWEVILVDNGSTDASVAVAQSFQKRLPQLRIIQAPERRGAAYARNQGARVARSEALAFCDADDEVGPGYLQAMTEALSHHPLVACRLEFARLNRSWISQCHTSPQTSQTDHGLLGPYTYAGGGSLGVKKSAHDAVHGFNDELSALEDTDYCVRLQRAGFHLHFAQAPFVHVRWRGTVLHAFNQARRWGRSFIVVQSRHWPGDRSQSSLRSLCGHLLRIRRVRSLPHLAQWIWATGWKVGLIEGRRSLQKNLHHLRGFATN
jgi:glycosyltransferase involved in cell wall biosynthesis